VVQDVLRKAEKAFKAFFARCKRSTPPGSLHYKGTCQFDRFTSPQAGFSLTHDNHLSLSKRGSIKVKMHRDSKGPIKTWTLKGEGDACDAVLTCDVTSEPMSINQEGVGIDLGLLHVGTLSRGERRENPRYFRKSEKKLAKHQQALACSQETRLSSVQESREGGRESTPEDR